MNKNWNDRADKDLFFTILSVKNIGVISGAEWTTIGNHMRSLGYGFTNEGCRQHFQGLRRAQNKSDTNGGVNDPQRRVDPTLNPITRRPGPGRGRPRKQPPGPVLDAPEGGPQPESVTPVPAAAPFHEPAPVPPPPELTLDPSAEEFDEQATKRAKLDEAADHSLDDEAVLSALTAHNAPTSDYPPEFGYGEA